MKPHLPKWFKISPLKKTMSLFKSLIANPVQYAIRQADHETHICLNTSAKIIVFINLLQNATKTTYQMLQRKSNRLEQSTHGV